METKKSSTNKKTQKISEVSEEKNGIFISLDKDVQEKLISLHSQLNKKNQDSINYSAVINHAIRNSLEKKEHNFSKCPECSKDGFTVPLSEEEETFVCFLCGFETKKSGNTLEKITFSKKAQSELKSREAQQTQELLVAITNDLYDKVEKLNSKENLEETTSNLDENPLEKKSNPREKAQIEFSDLSWYRKKLDENQSEG